MKLKGGVDSTPIVQKPRVSSDRKKSTYKPRPKIDKKRMEMLLDEFEQLKTYFRKGNRPSQTIAIKNFEKHLKELIE